MSRAHRRRAYRGFTLIELMIIVALLGVMVLAYPDLLAFATREHVLSVDRAGALTELNHALRQIDHDLASSTGASVAWTAPARPGFAPITRLTLSGPEAGNVLYEMDPAARTLMRTTGSGDRKGRRFEGVLLEAAEPGSNGRPRWLRLKSMGSAEHGALVPRWEE